MARMACISIPVLPLQILLHQHPDWREFPTAVVSEDKPLGRITYANKRAYNDGIRPGMRYATALTLQPVLRAGTVLPLERAQLENSVEAICGRYSPTYERCSLVSGVYWIDATGVEQIFESEYAWIRALRSDLQEAGYSARCVVGSSRRGTFSAARSSREIAIFRTMGEELVAMRSCRLETLPFDDLALLRMRHLGIEALGEFLDLKGADIRSRFGESSFVLHHFLSKPDTVPLQPEVTSTTYSRTRRFQQGVVGFESLLSVLEPAFEQLVTDARRSGVYFNRFELRLLDEDHREHVEQIQPAEPTREKAVFLRLFRIRLEAMRLQTPVYEFLLTCDAVVRNASQTYLIHNVTTRDQKKGAEALSLIRAENGNASVQVPTLKSNHDPYKRFEWNEYIAQQARIRKGTSTRATVVPDTSPDPVPDSSGSSDGKTEEGRLPVLCRRFFPTPQLLTEETGTKTVAGPYVLGGEWWRSEKRREYRFLQSRDREIYWSFRSDSSDMVYGRIG